MKKINKQYIFLGVAFFLYLLLVFTSKEPTNWEIHFNSESKDPYGTSALRELLEDTNMGMNIQYNRLTPYEIYDSLEETYYDKNLILIGNQLDLDDESINTMLAKVNNGKSVFLASEFFGRSLKDTLGFSTAFDFSSLQIKDFDISKEIDIKIDSLTINSFDEKGKFSNFELNSNFDEYDTLKTEVLARLENGNPVFIRTQVGSGFVYLLSTPKILTNIALLHQENYKLINEIIQQLPEGDYIRSEYYTLGRVGHHSSLRVVLSKDGLREAVQLSFLLVLIYLIIGAKREQRAIPVITPPKNESMSFIDTLSQLYLNRNDHRKIIMKRKKYLFHHIHTKYHINLLDGDINENVQLLSLRSGLEEEYLKTLFINIDGEINRPSENNFTKVNDQIDNFYSKEI